MLKRTWNYLITIGIDEHTPPAETRYISFLNAIVVLVVIVIAHSSITSGAGMPT